MKKLLEHRKALKDRKPHFLKQDTHKKPGIAKKWSRPKGIDSKMRLCLRGYRILVTKGWKSPSLVRGLHPTGLVQKLAKNVAEVERMDAKSDGLIISSTVGAKKKVEMIRAAQKMGLKMLNMKDPEGFITGTEKGLASRKKEREDRIEAKKKAEDKPKKAAKEKAPQAEEKSVEDLATEEEARQEQEKKEKDKILTKRE